MFYKLQLKDTAKKDERVFKGITLYKGKPVYVETDKVITGQANKAGIRAEQIDGIPARDEAGNNVVVRTV